MLSAILNFLSKVLLFTGMVSGRSSFPKPLSLEEERMYFKKFREEGDLAAKDELIRHNLRLVVHIAKKYNGMYENDDLISVGSIGLIKAINTYSPDKGTVLATFAAKCIENEILMVLRNKKKQKNNVPLEGSIGFDKEGNELTLMDLLFTSEEGIFSQVENKLLGEKLLVLLSENLTEREYTIICYRYGLDGKTPLPQREIARLLGISRSYISRIETKAIQKIREKINPEDFLL